MQVITDVGYDIDNPTIAPIAQTGNNPGNMATGNYQYKITFMSPFGETLASPASVSRLSNGSMVLTNLQVSVSTEAVQKVIYRTSVGDALPFRRLVILNSAVTTFNDTFNDSQLGVVEPVANTASSSSICRGWMNFSKTIGYSLSNNVVAAGASLSTATLLAAQYSFCAVPVNLNGVRLPLINNMTGQTFVINNTDAANSLQIYPYDAATTVNGLAAGSPYTLAPQSSIELIANTATSWVTSQLMSNDIPIIIDDANCNVFLGPSTGNSTMTGTDNTAMGCHTFENNTTGNRNSSFGSHAANANVSGNNNIAIGYNAHVNNISGSDNIIIGNGALASQTSASQQFAIGSGALAMNTTGTNNFAIGHNALQNSNGDNNIGIGNLTMTANTTGSGNLAVGYFNLNSNTTGNNNMAFGINSLATNVSGNDNIAIGFTALRDNTGSSNIALGHAALQKNTTGGGNLAIGESALTNSTTANGLVALGNSALAANTTGSSNLAIGSGALASNTTGQDNIAIGNTPLFLNTTGSFNIGIGESTLGSNTTASQLIAIGAFSLFSNTSGTNCIAMGLNVLHDNTTGNNNIGIGSDSLNVNSTGDNNIGLGNSALRDNTASNNVAVGSSSQVVGTSGANNTSVGAFSLTSNNTGSNNIAIGNSAGSAITGSGNIAIGNAGVAAESNVIRIGTAQTKNFQAGIRGVTTDAADAIPVLISSTGQLGTISSSITKKENIVDMGDFSSQIYKLQPRIFDFIDGPKQQCGLIAQEVNKILPYLTVCDKDGEPETVKYHEIGTLLLNEMIKLNMRLEKLESRI